MPTALAAVPDPTGSTAVVSLSVGDVRDGPTSIGPLPGAEFGLFRANPGSAINAGGFSTATPDYTCTSDTQGDCSFVVPIGAGPGEVGQNTRLWAAPISAPPGYYENPYWKTAPLTGGTSALLRHVFQTPPLVAGQSYRSGQTWMTDPGLQTTPPGSPADYTRRIASDGTWTLSRDNPALRQQCGLNVSLIVDLSSSVVGHVSALKSAMDAFVDALRGTPSQAEIVTFGTDSPANGFTNTGLTSVATTQEANAFKARYAGWGNPPTNYTNWDRGFGAAAASNSADPTSSNHLNLAVFLTDGNPTVYGPGPLGPNGLPLNPNSGFTRFREISNGLASANLLKSQGTRILGVGVGSGVDDPDSAHNLRTVSGPTAYTGGNIRTADYLQTANYADAGRALRDVVLEGCAPSISVIKRIVPTDWQEGGSVPIDSVAYPPSTQWQFTASTTTAGASVTPPATRLTDLATGALSFDVGVTPPDGPATFSVAETTQPGYTSIPGQTTCVERGTGTDVPVPVTRDSSTQFSIPVGLQDVVSCLVYNRAPNVPEAAEASVAVHKRWRLSTWDGVHDLPNGQQPSEFQSYLSLTGPSGAGASPQGWDEQRDGYAEGDGVGISEQTTLTGVPGCQLTGATIEHGAPSDSTPGSGPALSGTAIRTVAAGTNEWTITNKVTCTSRLTLRKVVASGDASPSSWTLTAIGPESVRPTLPGPNGRTGTPETTNVEVAANTDYQLAESADATPPELSRYAQTDLRTRPLRFPESTGSWACSVDGPGTEAVPSSGVEGAVSVPLGQTYTCTAENNTAWLTVIKKVVGGDARPDQFTFHLQPNDSGAVDAGGFDIPGADQPGTQIQVRPLRHYRLSEISGPPGYQLSDVSCASGVRDLAPGDIYVEPGGTAQCTATNTRSEWAATKTSDPPSGSQVRPGSVITYTVTARHVSGAATNDVEITDDLSQVLNHATLVDGSVSAESGTATLSGTALTWRIPVLDGTTRLTYQVRVNPDAWNVRLHNALSVLDSAGGNRADPCPAGFACHTTELFTPANASAPSQGPQLPYTGVNISAPLRLAALLLGLGIALLAAAAIMRKRRT